MRRRPTTVHALLSELRSESASQLTPSRWREVAAEAERRDVAPLLYARLRAAGRLELLPPHVRLMLEELYGFSALRNRIIHGELQAALRRLREAHIDVIVLKGAYLAEAVYGDIALRPLGDLDLLVREPDLDRAVLALSTFGYSERPDDHTAKDSHQLPALVRTGAAPIELHRRIQEWGDAGGLWDRSRRAVVAGEAAFRLSATDLVLQLCLHVGHHHRWRGAGEAPLPLRSLFDISLTIARFSAELDWQLLASMANQTGKARYAYAALRVVQSLAGAQVPAAALAGLGHDTETERMISVIEHMLTVPTGQSLPPVYADWRKSRALTARLELVLSAVFPPLQRLRAMYGLPSDARLAPLYYLIRPVDLVWRRGLAIARLTTGMAGGRGLAEREYGRDEVDRWIRG